MAVKGSTVFDAYANQREYQPYNTEDDFKDGPRRRQIHSPCVAVE
jgi:hypothetical protein